MSQMARAPELFCQRMSIWPSPLKSPEPTMLQEVATDGRKMLLPKVVPFMSQRAREPEAFCQTTSALPSPLKSLSVARGAEDTILKTLPLQPAGRAGPNRPELRTLLLRYHITVRCVLPL
jgi:hypothetical protein